MNKIEKLVFFIATLFLLFIIFLPAVYVLRYSFLAKNFFTPEAIKAILVSIEIGLLVTFIDVIFGLPLAWTLVKSKSTIVKLVDNLIDLSLVVPTAALGFSIYLYWGSRLGLAQLFGLETGIFSKGPILIILLHIVFTLPYMTKSIAASIAEIDFTYEQAALTLGANFFTIFRTIFFPLFKDGIIVGSILSFTRSLSETGATLMVAGAYMTAPVLIVGLKQAGQISQAAGVSAVMIASAITILFLSKLLLRKKTYGFEKAYPRFERSLLNLKMPKNIILALFFIFIFFLPSIYFIIFSLIRLDISFSRLLLNSLIISFMVAFVATLVNLIFAVPLAYLIARNKYGLGNLFDSLSEVVLLVPTSALGLSMVIFWQQIFSYEMLILIFAHLSFTFPLIVMPITAAIRNIPLSLEEASLSLGATKIKTFSAVILPLIKPALIAGLSMAFMRSLSETGATLAVSNKIKTAPVLIVELVKQGQVNQAAFTCMVLFIIVLIFLIILKYNKFSREIF